MELLTRKQPDIGPAAIQKLGKIEVDTWLRLCQKRTEINDLEADRALAFVDAFESGTTEPGENKVLQRLRSEVIDLENSLGPLRARRISIIEGIKGEKVAAMRDETSSKRSQLEELNKKSAALLQKWGSLEGINVDAAALMKLPIGDWSGWALPLSQRLQFEADNLERTANRLEAQTIASSGTADGTDLESLVRAIYSANPEAVTPPIADIEKWFAGSLERLAAFVQREYSHGCVKPLANFSAHLVWSDGLIQEGGSFVQAHNLKVSGTAETVLPFQPAPQTIIPGEPQKELPMLYLRRTFQESQFEHFSFNQ